MICPLGHEAAHFVLPHPRTATPMDAYQCAPCVREYVNGRWQRMAGYCDGCDAPTWRMLTHPIHGHRILLWPKPATRFALLLTPEGPGAHCRREYCSACCPVVGEAPVRVIAEVDAVPLVTGVCDGWETPHARYPFLFSDEWGAWFVAHATDGYGISEGERDHLLDQWERDRVPV